MTLTFKLTLLRIVNSWITSFLQSIFCSLTDDPDIIINFWCNYHAILNTCYECNWRIKVIITNHFLMSKYIIRKCIDDKKYFMCKCEYLHLFKSKITYLCKNVWKMIFQFLYFIVFRYSWTENLYGSSSFQSSPPNQSKLETKPPLNLPPAFEESNESFTFYPTSPSASNSSLLEVTDHLGTFRIAELRTLYAKNISFFRNW